MDEDQLMKGQLEPTNEAYALAKLVGIKQCQYYQKQYHSNFISCLPSNLYGPNDHYDAIKSHLVPALILKIHTAHKKGQTLIELWGSGKPRREFMYSDDCADAMIFLMHHYSDPSAINIGTGEDHTVLEIAQIVAQAMEIKMEFSFNPSKPDGILKKLLSVDKIRRLGWRHKIDLFSGVKLAYQDFFKRAVTV